MDTIATWSFSIDGVGSLQIYESDLGYAGGLALIGAGDGGGTGFAVSRQGADAIALEVSIEVQVEDQNQTFSFYCNSHYGDSMMVSDDTGGYESVAVGPEQTFTLINLGDGKVALRASPTGTYLTGYTGGWYPQNWSLGNGTLKWSTDASALQLHGDMLPLLEVTNSGYRTDLTGRDLGALDLTGANMQHCVLSQATLSNVTSLKDADFTSATLQGVHLGGQDLGVAKTWSRADFAGSDLTNIAGAEAAHLPGAILDDVNLSGCHLRGVDLTGASLKGAWLTGADLAGAYLEGADLTGAHMDRTILHDAHLEGTHFDGVDLTTAQFDAAPSFTRAVTQRTTFVAATVPFAVLATDWSYLDLTGATITGLPSAIHLLVADHALLPDELNLQGMNLAGASLVGTRMYGAQLQKANLESAVCRSALLKGAKLDEANLTSANFDSAFLVAEQAASPMPLRQNKLEAASVTGAFMFNTVLDGAHCDGVDFTGSLFVSTAALGSGSASAVGAFMNFAKFDSAHGVLAVFDGAQLSAASFTSATLVGASFQGNGTQLTPSGSDPPTDATIYKADIRGANFSAANMDGLDMRDATFATASGSFEHRYDTYAGKKVIVAFDYTATVLGVTTSGTLCPDGNEGPCRLTSVAEPANPG